ncbi:putative ribonuclease H protein [Nymphaea thermarum]|nr:putative ribonuclease H protein [Nymphaea thermarum]
MGGGSMEKKEISRKKRLTISQQSYERQPFQFSAIDTLAGGAGKGRLDYSFIFASLKSLWPGVADLKFTSVGKGMFLLRTSSEVDLKFILSPGRWYVGGRLLIANQWHPSMPMRIESSNRVRIWIRLPDLPVEWWNPRIFTDIAELIGGSFVEADGYTRHLHRFGFARINIEIPLRFSPISEIEMEISGGKIFVQTIEYETKVKYCHKCGSTAHFEGSCVVREAATEVEKGTPNGWQLVKTPRRLVPYNKDKEDPLKQNSFQVLTLLPEINNDKENSAKSLGGRATDNSKEKEKGLTNVAEANRAGEGAIPVAQSTKQGAEVVQASQAALVPPGPTTSTLNGHVGSAVIDSNPLPESNNIPMTEKVKKRTLKHTEEKTDLTMVEVTPELEEVPPSDDMDVGNVVAKTGSEAMDNDYEDDSSNDRMGSREGRGLVSNSNEKTGRAPAIQACIVLSNFVSQSALCEISCPDMKFTWTNNRVGQENVMSKIDRCYVSQEWLDDPELTLHLEVQPRTISDHNAILLYISKRRYNTWGRSPSRHFQYWQDMVGYSDLVYSAWAVDTRGCAMIKLIHKLEATRDKLKIWCKGEANNLSNQIMAMKTSIKFIQTQSERDMSEAIEEECRLKHELSRLLLLEERLWRQKSRIKWLGDGDLNTKFFQGIANGRRRRNKIETITHEGRLATDSLEIFSACTDFFATLLGSTQGSGCLPQSIAPGPTVTSEENDELFKPINDTEIKWAVMEADRDSAPRPDGFGNSFFQSNWSVVQEAMGGAIRGFFNTNRLVKSINKTHIILLPKEQGVMQVEKFWPISLCTSILKFITRIMMIDVTEEQCRHLVLRTYLKLTLWKQKCLSFASRLSLIKHALSMMPAYLSLVVKLPATTCKLLNKMAAEFLWGDMADHKNHHRIKWATLCLPKLEGAELVRGRYYERKALTDSSIRGKKVSKAWRKALQAWSRIKGDVRWKIGNVSFGGTIIGKEPNITKFVTGFALGYLGAMEASTMIDGLKSASLRGVRAAKKEWQASLETSLVDSVLAWLAGLRTTQGGGRQRFSWNALGTW